MATLEHEPLVRPLQLTDSEVRFYHDHGYLTLPGFLTSEAADLLREEVLTVLEANGTPRASLTTARGSADKLQQCSQYLAGSALDHLINGPDTLAVASRLIGGRAVRYLPFTAVKNGGGGGTMHFHQDNNYTRFICISKDLQIYPDASKMTLLMSLAHHPGALSGVLAKFASIGVTSRSSSRVPCREATSSSASRSTSRP